MCETVTQQQFTYSMRCRRHLESIKGKTLGDYQPDEVQFLDDEIQKHTAIIETYRKQQEQDTGRRELFTMLIPVTLTLENYQELHWNNAVGKLSKFKVKGTDEIVYSDEVEHKVDIDFPLGFFHAGGKIVDSIIIPKSVTVGELEKVMGFVGTDLDINNYTDVFEKSIDYLNNMVNNLYS